MERFSHSEQEKCPPAVMTFARSHSVSVLQHQLDVILNPDVRWLHFPSAFICEARLFGWFGECVVFLLDEVGRCWVRGSTYPWIQKLKKWLPASVFPPLSFRAWMGAETDSVLGFSPLINTFLWRKNRPVLTELIWKKLTNKKKVCGIQTWVFRQIKLWPQQSAVHTAVGRGQLVQSGETQVGQELHFALGKDAACTTIITQTRWDFGPRQFKDDFMSDSDICTRPPL